jgi:integrase
MANRKVTLQMYVKTSAGWRRYPAAYSKNGRVRPKYAIVNDEPQHFPDGHYEIKFYRGGKTQQRNVGDDAQNAELQRQKEADTLDLRRSAKAVGVKILEEPGRLHLAKQASKFVQAAEDRGSTVAAEVYKFAVEQFLDITGRVWADEIVPDDLLKFQRTLRTRKMSDRTISNRHSHVTAFLRYCELDVKALAPLKPKYEKTLPQIYTTAQMTAFFDSLKSDYHKITYGIALMCGLREQELMHLKWADVDTHHKVLTVRSAPEWGFHVKDKEERSIPIPDDLVPQLVEYHEQHPLTVFVTGTATDKPNTKLLRTLKRLVNAAGLQCGVCDGCRETHECGEWYLHCFRSSYITRLIREGVDVRTIMRLSGHSDLDTILKYMRPAENVETQAAINRIVWK